MLENERYLVEVDGEVGGIVVGDDKGFVFHASADWAWSLQGRAFPDVATAERALADRRRKSNEAA